MSYQLKSQTAKISVPKLNSSPKQLYCLNYLEQLSTNHKLTLLRYGRQRSRIVEVPAFNERLPGKLYQC